jgi:hypothetical protein
MHQQQVFLFHDRVSAAYAHYESLLFHDFCGMEICDDSRMYKATPINGFLPQ